jgi:hypothetical protein
VRFEETSKVLSNIYVLCVLTQFSFAHRHSLSKVIAVSLFRTIQDSTILKVEAISPSEKPLNL